MQAAPSPGPARSGAIVSRSGREPPRCSGDVPDGPAPSGASGEKKAAQALPGARGASEAVHHRYRGVFHEHAEGQLIWFAGAVQQLRTPDAIWVAPPGVAVWIPPREPHANVIYGDGVEHYAHIDAALCAPLPERSCLVRVTPALAAAAAPILAAAGSLVVASCLHALCAEIVALPVRPLATPLPRTLSRLSSIAELLEENPLDARTLEDWARFARLSASSLHRVVRLETGRSFIAWRLQLRLLWALEQLAAGTAIAEVSTALGYRRPDTFAEVFRGELGATPARYFLPLEPRDEPRLPALARSVTRASLQCTVRRAAAGQRGRGNESHAEGELVWAESGILTVTTPHGTWVLPAGYGIWIPPNQRHESRRWGETTMRRVRVDGQRTELPARCCAVGVSPALREAFEQIRAERGDETWDERDWTDVAQRLLGEFRDGRLAPIPLPLSPLEGLLVPVLAALRDDPATSNPLEHWARYLGVSSRTLKRAFSSDTGLPFSRWRLLLRLRFALERLAQGRDVADAAHDAGYSSVSSFVALFRRVLGTTPGRYFDASAHAGEPPDVAGA